MELGKITLYLSKINKDFSDVIDTENLPSKSTDFVEKNFSYEEKTCKFYCRQTKSSDASNPPWLDFVNSGLDSINQVNFGSSYVRPTGLLLINLGDRIVAASFGLQAGNWLKKYVFEPDFGVKVAMNLCGDKKVRQAKSSIQAATTQLIDRQLSKPSQAFDFGMSETEFIQYISAHLLDNEEVTLQGKDCLTIKISGDKKLSWSYLFSFIREFLDAFTKDTYKQLFPNYPNLTPVSDEKIEILDAKIISLISEKNFEIFHLSIPEFMPDDEYSFVYRIGKNNKKITIYSHINTRHIEEEKLFRNLSDISLPSLKSKKIYAYSHEESRIIEGKWWRLYDCIVAEVEDEGACYILSSGVWRKVDRDFYNAVNDFVCTIREDSVPSEYLNIPIFCKSAKKNKESVFNEEYCRRDENSILFDRSKLRIGKGRADKEFCDIFRLLDKKGEIIHVKRHGDSSDINHLFSQARFYCEFFLTDSVFVQEIRKYIQESNHARKEIFLLHVKEKLSDIQGPDYVVRLWILYNASEAKPQIRQLPLMAKYELKLTYEKLRNAFKFNDVVLSMIPVVLTNHKEEVTLDN